MNVRTRDHGGGRRRGANAIEFALILPVLLAILSGIVDYGWIYMIRTAATSAARAGARVGALTPQAQGPDVGAADAADDAWTGMGVPITPTIVAFRSGTPQLMVVRIQVNAFTLFGLVGGPSSIEVTATQQMEDQP